MSYLERTGAELFEADEPTATYQELATLLAPYAAKESAAATFQAAVQQLIDQTNERAKATTEFLAAQLVR